jgi:parallel beta-helix repeat protein
MRLIAAAAAFCALLVAVPAAAVDRVVDDNLAPCLSGRPLHGTIGAAVAAASPGETIVVCAGEYFENVVVDKADLTLRGQGIARLRPGSVGGPGIAVQADGVTIQGFDVSGYTFACGVTVDASRADLTNNRSHGNGSGICVVSGTGHRLRYNVTEVNALSGIVLSDVAGAHVGNNTTTDNGLHGIVASACTGSVTIDHNAAIENHGIGIYALDCDAPTITNNTVRGTGYIGAGNSAGIVVELGQDALVKLNLVTDAVQGILLTGTTGATVTFSSVGFSDIGIDVVGSDGVTVTRNNVSRSPIVDCRWDGTGTNVLTNNSCVTQQPPGAFD